MLLEALNHVRHVLRLETCERVGQQDRVALRVSVYDDALSSTPQLVIMEIFRIENERVAEIWGAGRAVKP